MPTKPWSCVISVVNHTTDLLLNLLTLTVATLVAVSVVFEVTVSSSRELQLNVAKGILRGFELLSSATGGGEKTCSLGVFWFNFVFSSFVIAFALLCVI